MQSAYKGRRLLVGLLLFCIVLLVALLSYGRSEPVEIRQQLVIIEQTESTRLTLGETSLITDFSKLDTVIGSRVYIGATVRDGSRLTDRLGRVASLANDDNLLLEGFVILEVEVTGPLQVSLLEEVVSIDDPFANRAEDLLRPLAVEHIDCRSCEGSGFDCLRYGRFESFVSLSAADQIYQVEYRLVDTSGEPIFATTYDLLAKQSMRSIVATSSIDCVETVVLPAPEEPTGVYQGDDFESYLLDQP